MKISIFAVALLATAKTVFCADAEEEKSIGQQKAEYFGSAKSDSELANFELDYFILEYPDVERSEVVQMWQGEQINVRHTITNKEDTDLTVVGLGGSFRDPITGEYMVNLTSNSVGPVVIEPGKSATVGQQINLDFLSGNYFLAPQVYVAFKDELKVIQARAQLVVIKEVPVSFFNPQLLFLELIFVALIGGVGYLLYPSYFQSYFKGTAPTSKKLTASSSSTSGYDPTWVPSHHQVTQSKAKTRKAY